MPRMAYTSFTAAILACPYCNTPNLYWNKSNGMTDNRGWPTYLKYVGEHAQHNCFACKKVFRVRSHRSLSGAK